MRSSGVSIDFELLPGIAAWPAAVNFMRELCDEGVGAGWSLFFLFKARRLEALSRSFSCPLHFGAAIGVKKSSAQITKYYTPETLLGRQAAAVVNFPSRQRGKTKKQVETAPSRNLTQSSCLAPQSHRKGYEKHRFCVVFHRQTTQNHRKCNASTD